MAQRSSPFWLLILAGMMVMALPLGLNMWADLDPVLQGVLDVRAGTSGTYPGSELRHLLEPPLGQKLPEGQKRTRVLQLDIPVQQAVLDEERTKNLLAAQACRRVAQLVTSHEDLVPEKVRALADVLDEIEIRLYPSGWSEEQAKNPPFTRRYPFQRVSRTFDRRPIPGSRTPGAAQEDEQEDGR